MNFHTCVVDNRIEGIIAKHLIPTFELFRYGAVDISVWIQDVLMY